MRIKTPYEVYKKTKTWKIIKKSLRELIKNNDLKLFTAEDYVIGYLCKTIEDSKNKDNPAPNHL